MDRFWGQPAARAAWVSGHRISDPCGEHWGILDGCVFLCLVCDLFRVFRFVLGAGAVSREEIKEELPGRKQWAILIPWPARFYSELTEDSSAIHFGYA